MDILRKAVIALGSLALGGCAALMVPVSEDVYHWQKTRPALPYTEHVIPQQAVQAYCSHTSRFVMACAWWDGEQCWIFAGSQQRMDMMRLHEAKHCEGWDHQVI